MAANSLPIPPKLDLDGTPAQQADDWKAWKTIWENYIVCTELNNKEEAVQVAHLLTYLGPKVTKLFATIELDLPLADRKKVAPVVKEFDDYFLPKKNVSMYRWNAYTSNKEGEPFNSYLASLRRLASTCEFYDLDDMLRDRIVFGIRDSKVRERLLRVSDLTLQKTVDICLASAQSLINIKFIDEEFHVPAGRSVHSVSGTKKKEYWSNFSIPRHYCSSLSGLFEEREI